ncbi:Uncharacterised protein [Mycobacteroides abscessus subsp. abscessus]|nr:Uncharacterised protein [Mycobacteroides abscessus subsp. abscessus]
MVQSLMVQFCYLMFQMASWFMSEMMRHPQRLQVMQVVMAQPTLGYSQKVVDYQLMLRYYRRYTGVVLLETYSWL